MADAPEPTLDDHSGRSPSPGSCCRAEVALQAPPNLAHEDFPRLLEAGIDDWGGISPVTPDHVNPEAPWPEIGAPRGRRRRAGLTLRRASRSIPASCATPSAGSIPACSARAPRSRTASAWRGAAAGASARRRGRRAGWRGAVPHAAVRRRTPSPRRSPQRARRRPERADAVALLSARGPEVALLAAAADARAASANGDEVTYVVMPEHQLHQRLLLPLRLLRVLEGQARREPARPAYLLSVDEVVAPLPRGLGARRHRGLPAGRHPPRLHRGLVPRSRRAPSRRRCRTCTCTRSRRSRSGRARRPRGCRSPTTSPPCATPASARCPARRPRSSTTRCARVLCPDKVTTAQWLEVMRTAHATGLRTTSTIMSATSTPRTARHLLALRDLQRETGGFTEFVPLPFVAEEAPIDAARPRRPGPTFQEARRAHAAARADRSTRHSNVQASWVKLGADGAARCSRRRERPRRHADERVDQPRRRRRPRPGAAARAAGGGHPRRGPHAAPAHDALRHAPAERSRAPSARRRSPTRRRRPTTTPASSSRACSCGRGSWRGGPAPHDLQPQRALRADGMLGIAVSSSSRPWPPAATRAPASGRSRREHYGPAARLAAARPAGERARRRGCDRPRRARGRAGARVPAARLRRRHRRRRLLLRQRHARRARHARGRRLRRRRQPARRRRGARRADGLVRVFSGHLASRLLAALRPPRRPAGGGPVRSAGVRRARRAVARCRPCVDWHDDPVAELGRRLGGLSRQWRDYPARVDPRAAPSFGVPAT